MVHYFVGDLPPNFAKSFGDDWDAELAGYPAWAILKARRFWLSRENKWKHRKPVPGELSEAAHRAMGPIIYAQACVKRWNALNAPKTEPVPIVQRLTPDLEKRREESRAIMAIFQRMPK